MNHLAAFSPTQYLDQLWNIAVSGYEGYPGGLVRLSSYLCANGAFGGNDRAALLQQTINAVLKTKPEVLETKGADYWRVFSGQGGFEKTRTVMALVSKYQQEFRAVKALQKYFKTSDFLQAMADDACFGLDCIGFVGTYLTEAGVFSSYPGLRPLDYANYFPPVKSSADIQDLSVVMLADGQHIQIIDRVLERKDNGAVKVMLCQSTSGGPQFNQAVTIDPVGGNYLDVEKFRKARANNEGTEAELRKKYTTPNMRFGYKGGAIFQLRHDGEPKNPVAGSVYVGTASHGLTCAFGPPNLNR